ncbi:S-adenosyl-L-methionine-dependent methyltransferase [Morchella conica CCBAS932]|uniref:S-adenosyl-L-methionine-dependent methyltransferase n=1 Tax=Morchella conica CCBAS932 TaxID=1392247 RepID=A0A3N4KJY1_9PEZI|nr:S-adenosyl-L-methionine-dependent methyltransferase [Morchella conica CCBAS932]
MSSGSDIDQSNPEFETWSLDPVYRTTIEINGRLYQQWALENGTSFSPVDEDERERLDRVHNVFKLVFDNRLIFPPVNNPQKILDCGFGSAAWAVEAAERYSNCEVIGVDISPHMMPEETPTNLWLQIDDLNQPFTFQTNEFDFIQSRDVMGGIKKDRWSSYVKDCVRILKPGGWLQLVEIYPMVQSDNGMIDDNHILRQVSKNYFSSIEDTKDPRAPLKLDSMMREAGLVELGSRMVQLHLNGWSNVERDRLIGEKYGEVFKDCIEGLLQIPFKDKFGMSINEVRVMAARFRQEVDNKSLKPYFGL